MTAFILDPEDLPASEQVISSSTVIEKEKPSASYQKRMVDLAIALHNRIEAKHNDVYCTKKRFLKKKKANKVARKSRKKNRK